MTKIAIVGLQNGDEGKGSVTDYLAKDGKILIVRYQGGTNAGHTVVINDKNYKLHQLPSGIIVKSNYSLLSKGVFLHARKLPDEIKGLISEGIDVNPNNFGISSRTHVTLDYHTNEDQANFNLAEHSSTGNGIKQTARDKANRTGIRFVEFLDNKLMAEILKEKTFPEGMPEGFGDYKTFTDSYNEEREFLAKFLVEENKIFKKFQNYDQIFEGAQGNMLCQDDGQFPGITSSNPCKPSHRVDRIIGVLKAYVSSVGINDRPFVTEMDQKLQKKIIKPWGEYGTTTGKPRHIGWFDVIQGKYAIDCSQADTIVLTCLDKLELLSQQNKMIKVAVGYNVNGKVYSNWDASFDRRDTLKKVVPIYESFEPWEKTIENDGQTLTPKARKYVLSLEEMLGKKFTIIGVGPERNQKIIQKEPQYFL